MRELAIHNPSNVAIDYQLAPLTERSFAFVIDVVLVAIVGFALSYALTRILVTAIGDDSFLYLFLYVALPVGVFLGYFFAFEYFGEGRTPGKRGLGLRTIRIDGAPPTAETYALRSAMLFVDFLATSGALGLLAAGSSPLRQRVGDRIAQTVVIRSRVRNFYQLEDILSIRTADDHAVTYPTATNLNLEQALVLKELVVRWDARRNKALSGVVQDAATRLAEILGLDTVPPRQLEFIRAVLRDYIVLTR